ncbi:MAG: DUF5828 family protein [Halalkalicoccus sp.]
MEERIAGFRVRDDWDGVVEHGERVTEALRDAGRSGDAVEEWDEWRPKPDENLDPEIRDKTAEQVHISQGPGEKKGRTPGEDMLNAGRKLTDAYEDIDENNTNEAINEWRRSLRYVTRALDSAGREVIRPVEDVVYKRVMTKLSPFYFDNELIHANLQHGRGRDREQYIFEVNITDDELNDVVSEHLQRNDHEQTTETEEPMPGVKTNCPSCGHRWSYDDESTSYVTCPDCGRSVRIKR